MTNYEQDPEYAALLRAVEADPDDRLPQLVLADWLDERGHTGPAGRFRSGAVGRSLKSVAVVTRAAAGVWMIAAEIAARQARRAQRDEGE